MVEKVGQDEFGKTLKSSLKSDGVNVDYIFEKEGIPTGVAAIIVEKSGNNAITVASGANFELVEEDIERAEIAFENADVMLVQLETPMSTVSYALRKAKKIRLRTILNPATGFKLSDDILNHTTSLRQKKQSWNSSLDTKRIISMKSGKQYLFC